jgi:NlpC/P60 family protein
VRRLIGVMIVLALVYASAAFAGTSAPSWAQADIRLAVARGLLPKSAVARPDDPLTQGELAQLATALSFTAGLSPIPAAPIERQAPVTLAQLDAKLVRVVGLSASASRFRQAARTAALKPPSRFGTEAVARLLGLRTNHPAAHDARELRHDEPATLAEAAYSAARILAFRGHEVERVRAAASAFSLPALDPWQKRVLATAVGRIGFPYIWGGTSDRRQTLAGVSVNGGFDCSGFAWHVFKQPHSGGAALAAVVKGRTAAAMAAEVAPGNRVPFARLRPADLVFFGTAGPRSKPAQIDHMGIALGNGWMIHSSRFGVGIVELKDWYRERFAWGRRPLAEAGLSASAAAGAIPPGIR